MPDLGGRKIPLLKPHKDLIGEKYHYLAANLTSAKCDAPHYILSFCSAPKLTSHEVVAKAQSKEAEEEEKEKSILWHIAPALAGAGAGVRCALALPFLQQLEHVNCGCSLAVTGVVHDHSKIKAGTGELAQTRDKDLIVKLSTGYRAN